VAELNQTYTNIIKEAEQHVSANTGKDPGIIHNACGTTADPRPGIERPRYQPVRLLGDRKLAEVATEYLNYKSERLRPGSYKAVRFAAELLVSHLGKTKMGGIIQAQGREVLSLITHLLPNVRKYSKGRTASLIQLAELSAELEPGHSLAPQTQGRIWKHMLQVFDWCVEQGELSTNPWEHLTIREKPEVNPHKVLTDEQVVTLLQAKDRVLSSALLFAISGLMIVGIASSVIASEVNVYSHRQPELIAPLTDAFTEKTGIAVSVAYLKKGWLNV
jgi:hypothetical protein